MAEQQVVVRFYTRARKIPFMLGKLGDFKIPFGPYTLTQGVVFVAAAWIGSETMWLWARGWVPLLAWLVLLAVAAGCAVGAGRIPFKGRNPLMLAAGIVGYGSAPPWGIQGGSRIALGGKRRVRHRSSTPTSTAGDTAIGSSEEDMAEEMAPPAVDVDPVPTLVDASARQRDVSVQEAPSGQPTPHQLTEVQQILAASAQRR